MHHNLLWLLSALPAITYGLPRPASEDGPYCKAVFATTTMNPIHSITATATYAHARETGTRRATWTTMRPPRPVSSSLSDTPPSTASDGIGRKNIVYFTNWGVYAANYTPENIPVHDVTHVLYGFGEVASDGTIPSDPYTDVEAKFSYKSVKREASNVYGCIQQLFQLKKANRKLKTLLSIGGARDGQAAKFASAASTDTSRNRFAQNVVQLVADYGLDGVDLDWEYPQGMIESNNFLLLLRETRQALDKYAKENEQNYRYLLTVAVSASPEQYKLLDIKAMDSYIDSWHLMAYDYAGSWDTTTGHQANIYSSTSNAASTKFNSDQAIDDYIDAGVAPEKIILGMPLYGRSFLDTNGMGDTFDGTGPGSIDPGVWLYRDLPRPGATEHLDEDVIAAYSYDDDSGMLVSYDTPDSAKLKVDYLMNKGLGGVVFWEASGDKSGDESLVQTVANRMVSLDQTQNMLSYPKSRYENVRNGMERV